MKTLIVYATKHGCTEQCAMKIKDDLKGETILVDIKKGKPDNLDSFDAVIVGGSIHAGFIQNQIKKFCQDNLSLLLQKRIGLYICHMEEGEKARKEFEDAFPNELRDHASAHGLFGGALDFDKMNFMEKAILKKVAGVEKSISKIDENNVEGFIEKMNN
jgi:menaquinone-dependent protoporphyrinogen oxidase